MSENNAQQENVVVKKVIKSIISLADIRLDQSFERVATQPKRDIEIHVRKPNKQEFVRVHGSKDFRENFKMLHLKEPCEHFLVDRSLWIELDEYLVAKTLFFAVNRKKQCFVWPVKLPYEDGYIDTWNKSARSGAEAAMNDWVSVRSDHKLKQYVLHRATGNLGQPTWPNLSFEEIVNIAFKDKYITSADHPAISSLRG